MVARERQIRARFRDATWRAHIDTRVAAIVGGHGAPLSPLPPGLSGLLGDLLNDPPGFDRARMVDVDRKIAAFFRRHLGV